VTDWPWCLVEVALYTGIAGIVIAMMLDARRTAPGVAARQLRSRSTAGASPGWPSEALRHAAIRETFPSMLASGSRAQPVGLTKGIGVPLALRTERFPHLEGLRCRD
jgi:hypothetical protein